MSTATAKPGSRPRKRAPEFIRRLYDALETAQREGDDTLRWVAPGQFEITGDTKGALTVLQRRGLNFNMFSSFVRQLSYYNFKRLSDRRRTEARGKPLLKPPIQFGHPCADFYTGNEKKALAAVVRKGRNRDSKNCRKKAGAGTDQRAGSADGASSPSGSERGTDEAGPPREFSVISSDSYGGAISEDYEHTNQPVDKRSPVASLAPSRIDLTPTSSAGAIASIYPTPTSPDLSIRWSHHAPSAGDSRGAYPEPYRTENPFAYNFGSALSAPHESLMYPHASFPPANFQHLHYQDQMSLPQPPITFESRHRWSYPGNFGYLPTPQSAPSPYEATSTDSSSHRAGYFAYTHPTPSTSRPFENAYTNYTLSER